MWELFVKIFIVKWVIIYGGLIFVEVVGIFMINKFIFLINYDNDLYEFISYKNEFVKLTVRFGYVGVCLKDW